VLAAFAIVGFVVLPAVLSLDLLAPGRHFAGGRSPLRRAAGGAAALGVALGLSAAVGRWFAPAPWFAAVGGRGHPGARWRRPPGPARWRRAVLTPDAWLDDRLARVVLRALVGGVVLFGVLRVPLAAGLLATLAFAATSVRAVADAVATPAPGKTTAGLPAAPRLEG